MKTTVLWITFLALLFVLRRLHLRFADPVRQARRERTEKLLVAISHYSSFVGQPERILFDALGPEDSSASMDFGLVVHDWRIGQLGVRAYTRNELCESFEIYERDRSN